MYTDIAPASGFDLTGDAFIDALFAPEAYFRTKWAATLGGKTSISYSFPFLNGLVSKFTDTYGAEPAAAQHFGVNALQVAGIDQAFQRWADVANLSFIKVPEDASGVVGDIRISFSSEVTVDFWGYTKIYSDGSDPSQGDIWIEPGIKNGTFQPGTYDFVAMMHEIGHALGLDHPFEGNIIPAGYDDVRYTIMSYTAPKGVFFFNGADPQGRFIVETPGVYDIAAVQDIYGANMTFHSGRDSYIFTPDNPVYQTIWDAGGIDTFDVADFTKGCSITLVPGTYSLLGYDTTTLDANIGIAFNCIIENVSGGSGDDRIVGNDVANVLIGGEGNDTLSGGGGNDVIEGCAGTDTENGGSGNDTFSAGTDPGNDALNGSEGTDVVSYARAKAGVTVDLAAGTASGTDAGDMASIGTDSLVSIESVIGGAFADKLIGNANNNTLTGGRGDDQLLGGSGSDTASYANASGGMKASLALTAPQDTISDGKDTLSSIENLTGSAYNDVLTGNTAANILDGGKGADILIGGLGNDSYRIDNSGDNIVEDLGAGHDIVIASLTFTLSANVEDLTLIGAGAVNGTGNALVNVLRGNAASNVLSGGRAADQLFGGGGSDTLVGGADRDLMTGGTGADTFRFVDGDFGGLTNRTCDTIIDFNHSEGDRIDLSGVDANTKNGNANDAFTFIGSDPFNQIAGQLRATLVSGVTVLQGDTNGDGAADFWIRCDHAPTLAVGDLEL